MLRPAVSILLVVVAGCSETGTTGGPTFADDVAAIVYASCTPCHRPGGPTPFSLLGYDDVYKHRRQIARVTRDKLMPPWLPTHGDFIGDRRLEPESLTLLQDWIAAGAPRGDAGAEPPCPEFPDEWQLRAPDLIVTATETVQVPASGPDQIRNLIIPIAINAPRYVEAVEIQPRSPAVHHAILLVDPTRDSRRLDALDPEPGYPGMTGTSARPPDGHFIGWTPGKRTRPNAAGMAWQLNPGQDFVLQLHLAPTGKAEHVRPRFGLYFTDSPPTVISFPLTLYSEDIDLPAGATDQAVHDHYVVPVPIVVHSIYPHAHYLCTEMVATVTPPGGAQTDLFRIGRWDFDWQDDYSFRDPIRLPAGTRIDFEYRYDNSADNPANPSSPPRRVRFGQESTDEMATLTLQVATADHDARRILGASGLRRDLDRHGSDVTTLLELARVLREMQQYDEALTAIARVREQEPNHTGALLEMGLCLEATQRQSEAERIYRECIARDPSNIGVLVQLANILTLSQRTAEAIALYQKALDYAPQNPTLHNNLAAACMSVGQLGLAEQHFRSTLAIDSEFFQAWFNLGRVLAVQGRQDEARRAFTSASALRPGDARVAAALRDLNR